MKHFSDSRFVERIRAGDREAIRKVVEAYLPQILNAARASGLQPQRAEDVAQATFVTFIERASQFEGRSHVRTWLFGILYRKIAEARRGLERDRATDDIEDVMSRKFNPDGTWRKAPQALALYGAEIRTSLDACLDELPTGQRMAFVLRESEGLSTEEICKILDVTRTNLGVLFYRGRNRLRECLELKGVKEDGGSKL